MSIRGSYTETVSIRPEDVFAAITDLDALPHWNAAIRGVVERPASSLAKGDEWVVAMHALGRSWHSRSVADELDPSARRVAYRSRTDDGNPSVAHWEWTVQPSGDASEVTVSWDLRPATFWRRTLLVRVRARQLAKTEVPASLKALTAWAASRAPYKQESL
jgi:uncharacterized protein YndB with AHSA1/START domain